MRGNAQSDARPGVAPIDASSGQPRQHSPQPPRQRQLNGALHKIAIVQELASDGHRRDVAAIKTWLPAATWVADHSK
jgi:hypothetical protein